jgi:NAD(P)-dependent dehydrogenase (short-subunit alcohol dehydrogenase family)
MTLILGRSLDDARKLFETNFWGTLRVIQTLVPSMRERKTGAIVNISSASFWAPPPGGAIYAASKFAMEGLSESLATELSSFNVRVLTILPGDMKTAFYDPKKLKIPTIPDAYKGTAVDYAYQMFRSLDQTAAQDPGKTAEAIVNEVLKPSSDPPVSKMPLGKVSIGGARKRAEEYVKTADQLESIAAACDFSK